MKLLPGIIARNNPYQRTDPEIQEEFKLNRLLGVFIQVANALDFAHEHGLFIVI